MSHQYVINYGMPVYKVIEYSSVPVYFEQPQTIIIQRPVIESHVIFRPIEYVSINQSTGNNSNKMGSDGRPYLGNSSNPMVNNGRCNHCGMRYNCSCPYCEPSSKK